MNKIVVLFTFSVILCSGCGGDRPVEPPETVSQVVIYFSTKSLSDSQLKSTASPDENLISKIILFGVDDQNKVVETFPSITNPSLNGITLTITNKEVKSFYAIANPSTSLEGAKPSTVSDLMNLTGDFATPPVSPFLMSGKGNIVEEKVNIELIRVVAKIEIKGIDGFQIETVTVTNTPDKGYVFMQATLSVPSSAGRTNYPAITSTAPILYVAESAAQNPVSFVVTGQLNGLQAIYTIKPLSEGKAIDIVRNSHYLMNIKPITEDICDVTINIPEWNGVIVVDDVEIPDEAFK